MRFGHDWTADEKGQVTESSVCKVCGESLKDARYRNIYGLPPKGCTAPRWSPKNEEELA